MPLSRARAAHEPRMNALRQRRFRGKRPGPYQHPPHLDGWSICVSFFMFLNDYFEGGENVMLTFGDPHNRFAVQPRVGRAVGFRRNTQLHAALPLRKGTRCARALFHMSFCTMMKCVLETVPVDGNSKFPNFRCGSHRFVFRECAPRSIH